MEIFNLLPKLYAHLIAFILIFTRIGTFFITFIVFKNAKIANKIVVSLSALLSFYVFLAMKKNYITIDILSIEMMVQFFIQVAYGFLIGFILNILFAIFLTTSQFISLQIGLSNGSLLDPRFGSITGLSHIYVIIASFLFFNLNGHLYLIKLLLISFDTLPVFYTTSFNAIGMHTLNYSSMIFSGALSLAVTVTTANLLANFALAAITKFAPQFNILSLGTNLQIVVGLSCVYITYWIFVDDAKVLINDFVVDLSQWIHNMRAYG